MAINRDRPERWQDDIAQSKALYNAWFMRFAPQAFRDTRVNTARQVEAALRSTANLRDVSTALLRQHPGVLPMLRMSTCPPIARDRLIGLAGVPRYLVESMEDPDDPRLPQRLPPLLQEEALQKIGDIIERMADPDIFVWLGRDEAPTEAELARAAGIVADRLCSTIADPIIRNAQEKRQLDAIAAWLDARGYSPLSAGGLRFDQIPPGSYAFRLNVPVRLPGDDKSVSLPVDAVVMPKDAKPGDQPLLIEAKSAGDHANVNKRRKEEAQKMSQLRATYGDAVRFSLFLCGYFGDSYLEYEAAEGIDWVWEHRIDDLAQHGL